jgi:hypothetical protein
MDEVISMEIDFNVESETNTTEDVEEDVEDVEDVEEDVEDVEEDEDSEEEDEDSEEEDVDSEEEDSEDSEEEDVDSEEEDEEPTSKRISNDEELELTSNEKDEVKEIKRKSLTKRYEYYKKLIFEYENSKDYNKNRSLFRISNGLKDFNLTNRLDEHPEYFINDFGITENRQGFNFTGNQKLLKKFLSISTKNMGILLYHGVGVGKTCSSILMAENFVNIFDKQILVFLPSSLEANYRKELFDVSRLNFEKQTYDACNGSRYLEMIPDWHKMSRSEISKKVQKMINNDYKFYGYLKIVNVVSKIHKLCKEKHGSDKDEVKLELFMRIREMFSNRVVIIDEVHNIRLSDDMQMKKFPKILKLILKCAYNLRLIMLSATPMFDDPVEISWIMEFLFTNDKYHKKYNSTIEFDDGGKLTKLSKENLKYFSKHYVSYIRGYDPKYFPIVYYNKNVINRKPKFDMLKRTSKIEQLKTDRYDFYMSEMTGSQLKTYSDYNKEDTKKRNMQLNIQLSNIVYPSKLDSTRFSVGKSGFMQTFEISEDSNLLKVKYKTKHKLLEMKNLKEASSKIYSIIEILEKTEGTVIIYSKFLYSGLIPVAIALEHLGYSKYNNNNILSESVKRKENKKYIMLTADEKLSPNNVEELRAFNDTSNKDGSKIKIALINEIASEGVSFKNIRQLHILEPWYNMKKTDQIIGRGVRYKSHELLEKEKQNIGVYLHVNTTKSEIESVDYRRYRVALRKLEKIAQIEKIMQENAIDCHFQDHSLVSLKSEIIDAHGKQRTVLTEYNNIACVNKVKVPDLKLDQLNEKMITFDLIQLSKNIRNIIEQHSLYHFDIDLI